MLAYHEALVRQGVPSEWMSLPKLGTTGNSHMMMMDRNSDQIAEKIQTWMQDKGLMKAK